MEGKCLDVAASQYRKIREPGPTFLYRSVMFVLFCCNQIMPKIVEIITSQMLSHLCTQGSTEVWKSDRSEEWASDKISFITT